MDISIECSSDRSLLPFPWWQRKSFTPEAHLAQALPVYMIVCSCHRDEQDNKRYSCPGIAPKTTIRLREDSTT